MEEIWVVAILETRFTERLICKTDESVPGLLTSEDLQSFFWLIFTLERSLGGTDFFAGGFIADILLFGGSNGGLLTDILVVGSSTGGLMADILLDSNGGLIEDILLAGGSTGGLIADILLAGGSN